MTHAATYPSKTTKNGKIYNSIFQQLKNKIRRMKVLPIEWSQLWILSTDSRVKTTLLNSRFPFESTGLKNLTKLSCF